MKFEDSKADKKLDAKMAKKAKVSVDKFEGSKADNKMDKKGQAKLDKKHGK